MNISHTQKKHANTLSFIISTYKKKIKIKIKIKNQKGTDERKICSVCACVCVCVCERERDSDILISTNDTCMIVSQSAEESRVAGITKENSQPQCLLIPFFWKIEIKYYLIIFIELV